MNIIEHIKFLRSKVAGRVPAPSVMEEGEIALNLTDKRIFSKDGSEVVIFESGMPRVKTFMQNQTMYGGGYAFIGTDGRPYISTRGYSGNARAQLPGNRTENMASFGLMEVPVPHDSDAKAIGMIGNHVGFVLMENGRIYTWGANDNGECGNGTTEAYCDLRRIDSEQLFDMVENPRCIGWNGNGPMCYARVKDTYNWVGWGFNNAGQGVGIGSSTLANLVSPTRVSAPKDGVGIVRMWCFGAARPFTFCLGTDGLLYGIGGNDNGALGIGNTTHQTAWQPVDTTNMAAHFPIPESKWYDDSYFELIAGHGYNNNGTDYAKPFSMLRIDGHVYATGNNEWGILGQGNKTHLSVMTAITEIPQGTITKIISNGAGGPTPCHALTTTGDVWSWGYGGYYELANGSTATVVTPFKSMVGVANIYGTKGASNYAHCGHFYAIMKDGSIYGWGDNNYGQMVLTSGYAAAPTEITLTNWNWVGDIREIIPVTTGLGDKNQVTYVITTDGRLYATGRGDGGSQNGWYTTASTGYTAIVSVPRRLV